MVPRELIVFKYYANVILQQKRMLIQVLMEGLLKMCFFLDYALLIFLGCRAAQTCSFVRWLRFVRSFVVSQKLLYGG